MSTESATEAAPTRLRSSMRGARLSEAGWGYGFVLVPIVVFGLFFIYPFIYAIYISFLHWGILGKQPGSSGTYNYAKVLHDPVFHTALKNIAEYTIVVVPLELALGLSLALLINQKIRGRNFFPVGLLLPLDRLVGRDHDDHPLHLQRQRSLQPHLRLQHGLVRKCKHRLVGDRRPERLDDLGDGDDLLSRCAPVDPD